MSPTINNNDYVISLATKWQKYKPNDIVICEHPIYKTIIKRIIKVNNNGDIYLAGDNYKSTSSELIGWQPKATLKGKVVKHIKSY